MAIGPNPGKPLRDIPAQRNVRLPAIGVEDYTKIVQGPGKIYADNLRIAGASFELEGRNLVQRFYQGTERFEVLVPSQAPVPNQAFIYDGDRAADIPNLMRNRSHQDSRALH